MSCRENLLPILPQSLYVADGISNTQEKIGVQEPSAVQRDLPAAVFLAKRPGNPAYQWLILLTSGYIETNPGPIRWPSGKCGRSAKFDSIRCGDCRQWTHRTCLGLTSEPEGVKSGNTGVGTAGAEKKPPAPAAPVATTAPKKTSSREDENPPDQYEWLALQGSDFGQPCRRDQHRCHLYPRDEALGRRRHQVPREQLDQVPFLQERPESRRKAYAKEA